METFSDWLTNKLKDRGMSPADLARATGKDDGVISRILNGSRKPKEETIIEIAKAIELPPEIVFQASAGLLSAATEKSEQVTELIYLFNLLPENQKSEVIEYIRFKSKLVNK